MDYEDVTTKKSFADFGIKWTSSVDGCSWASCGLKNPGCSAAAYDGGKIDMDGKKV